MQKYIESQYDFLEDTCVHCESPPNYLSSLAKKAAVLYEEPNELYKNNHTSFIDVLLNSYHNQHLIQLEDQYVYYEDEEYLKRIYGFHEYNNKINMLTEYYKYHNDVPRIFMNSITETIQNYVQEKREFQHKKLENILSNGNNSQHQQRNDYHEMRQHNSDKLTQKLLKSIQLSYEDFEKKQKKLVDSKKNNNNKNNKSRGSVYNGNFIKQNNGSKTNIRQHNGEGSKKYQLVTGARQYQQVNINNNNKKNSIASIKDSKKSNHNNAHNNNRKEHYKPSLTKQKSQVFLGLSQKNSLKPVVDEDFLLDINSDQIKNIEQRKSHRSRNNSNNEKQNALLKSKQPSSVFKNLLKAPPASQAVVIPLKTIQLKKNSKKPFGITNNQGMGNNNIIQNQQYQSNEQSKAQKQKNQKKIINLDQTSSIKKTKHIENYTNHNNANHIKPLQYNSNKQHTTAHQKATLPITKSTKRLQIPFGNKIYKKMHGI